MLTPLVSRETLIQQHTSPIAKELLDTGEDRIALVFDGTYSYHQKSSFNAFQRHSYSLQKGRPLAKPFIGCTTTGYIIQVWEPFSANSSDGSILPQLLDIDHSFKDIINPGEIFILDRGFRNCVPGLEGRGLEVLMPTCKKGQLSPQEANNSRFCTKLRWVIESVNGILKSKFKLLDRVTPNQSLCKVEVEYKIAACLHNMFGPKLSSDHSDFQQIVSEMKIRKNKPNKLQDHVLSNNLNRKRAPFVRIEEASEINFPQLTWEQLRMITLGSYQLKQANGYLIEHFTIAFRKEK